MSAPRSAASEWTPNARLPAMAKRVLLWMGTPKERRTDGALWWRTSGLSADLYATLTDLALGRGRF